MYKNISYSSELTYLNLLNYLNTNQPLTNPLTKSVSARGRANSYYAVEGAFIISKHYCLRIYDSPVSIIDLMIT